MVGLDLDFDCDCERVRGRTLMPFPCTRTVLSVSARSFWYVPCLTITVAVTVMSVRGAMAENACVGQYDLMPTNFIFMAFYFVLSKGACSSARRESASLC